MLSDKKFIENESYIHKHAKYVMSEWLNETKGIFSPFSWKHQGERNILQEYPICKFNENVSSWDIIWDEFVYDDDLRGTGYVPSFHDCIKKFNVYPVAIIDLVIMNNGVPTYAIEICHKNPLSNEKKEKLKLYGIHEIYEVDASWIMKQIKIPQKIKYKLHDLNSGKILNIE